MGCAEWVREKGDWPYGKIRRMPNSRRRYTRKRDVALAVLVPVSLVVLYSIVVTGWRDGNASAASGLPAVQAAAWAPAPAPVPPGDTQVVFDSMACPAANWCTAVAAVSDLGGQPEVYIYNYIDGFWDKELAPGSPSTGANITCSFCYLPIACPEIGYCVSLSGSPFEAVTETDGRWQADHIKAPQNSTITSISCAAVGQCAAVRSE